MPDAPGMRRSVRTGINRARGHFAQRLADARRLQHLEPTLPKEAREDGSLCRLIVHDQDDAFGHMETRPAADYAAATPCGM